MNFKYLIILFLILLLAPFSFGEEIYTEKDVLDAKTHAFALYNVSQKDEALEILNKIPRKYLTEEICIVKANIYEDKEDLKNAYKELNLALQINPKSYKVYYNLGLLAYKDNDITLAINNFKKSIKYNSQFAYSYYNLALCHIKQEDYKKAKNFYYNLALVYKKLNKEKYAEKILDSYNKMN